MRTADHIDTVPLSNALSKENAAEFHFIEGGCEAAPVEGITQFYQGPYLSFYPWPPRMEEAEYSDTKERAYELIYEAIEEDGPFDALLGFSQGASLAYLFLQQHARKHPYDPPWSLFRCAVFICGMPPFRSKDSRPLARRESSASLGQSVDAQELSQCLSSIVPRPSPRSEESTSSVSSLSSFASTSSEALTSSEPSLFSTGSTSSRESSSRASPASSTTSIDPNSASFILESDDFELLFDEDFKSLRIPSLHIGGKSDKVYELTRKLYAGMDKGNALWVEHELGHTIPWDKKNTRAFVDAIKQLERRTVLA